MKNLQKPLRTAGATALVSAVVVLGSVEPFLIGSQAVASTLMKIKISPALLQQVPASVKQADSLLGDAGEVS